MLTKLRGMTAGLILSGLIVLLCQTYEVMGITCYQCNSEFDPRCGDPFDSYSLASINCSLKTPLDHMPDFKPVLCRKIVQKVYGKVRINRDCGYITDADRDDKACVKRSGTHDVFAVYCSCTTDLCNAGPSLWPNYFITIAAILSLVVGSQFMKGGLGRGSSL